MIYVSMKQVKYSAESKSVHVHLGANGLMTLDKNEVIEEIQNTFLF
jgi:hypothetical protein